MNVGVNTRIYQNANTGIPYYIENLYKKCLEIDKKNNYIFFQTAKNKKIGSTVIKNLKNTSLNAFLFDNFLVNELINRSNITIYHGPASMLPIFKKKNIKYIVTVHDLSFLLFPKNHSNFFNIYYKFFLKKSFQNADIIVADSKNTKKDIMHFYHVNANKIKVIYPGVNEIFSTNTATKRIISDKYFLTLSTHPKRKNIYRILEVFSLNKNLHDIKFVIAGLIPQEQILMLKEKIKKLEIEERVLIYGYVTEEDLKSLYRNAEFFIYPSYYEGFGFPVLEAMISQCPFIASNTSSIPEITPNKDWLIDPYNSKMISKTIDKLIELPIAKKKEMIKENYLFAKKFTWNKTAEEMISLFKQ